MENFIENERVVSQNPTVKISSTGKRFLAFIIDTFVLSLIFWLFVIVSPASSSCTQFHLGFTLDVNGQTTYSGVCGFSAWLFVLVYFLYYLLLEWLMSSTIGKFILKIKVVTIQGVRISFMNSFVRNVFRIIDFLPSFYILGAIVIGSTENKQRIGDKVAKTLVVLR
jgi:uncharacterized RDD family membrane protein YckC